MNCAQRVLLVAAILFGGAAQANDQPAKDQKLAKLEWLVIGAATSDYTYRGVSLNNEQPTPLLYVASNYGILYANGFVVGTDLGSDQFGEIGTIEVDVTAGIMPTFGAVTLNVGARATFYPNGEDRIIGTLDKAERDFVEPFAGATLQATDALSVGAMLYWTPDFYYQTGEVTTVEAQVSLALPAWHSVTSKLTAIAGRARSEQADIIAPGRGYTYWNAGIEARLERLIFDLRYWDTNVSTIDEFGSRFVVSAGIALN